MSGRQIGTVVGGVVGAVVAAYTGQYEAVQIGMAVGGMIGGAVDPTKVYGPHVGDGQAQSATDGSPISWVMGTAWVAGCIVDLGASQEFAVKQDTGGKGSGTEQYSYEAHQNFSILVCESDAIKGSTIQSVLMVEQDGKIVYDMRPGSTILDDSAKYQSRNFRLYYGAEDQEPLSDYDGDHGVGNEPAYRGVLLAFFTQFNTTAAGGRIPSFRFLVSSSTALTTTTASGDNGWGDEYTVNVESAPGWFTLYYATGGIPDKFEIWDGDTLLASTPWVGDTSYQSELDTTLADHSEPSATITQYPYPQGTDYPPGVQFSDQWADPDKRSSLAFHKTSNSTSITIRHYGLNDTGWTFGIQASGGSPILLSDAVTQICQRGGLDSSVLNVSDLATASVQGYTIAKQMNAVNALGPLLGSYFAYASEYDGKINFHFYGVDAVMTIDEDDILEANDANDNNVTSNLRNNATEFPKRIIGQYYDPAQNYMPVTVMDARKAAGVTATGDLAFDIPVAMDANTAQQTVNKAMKVAYAQLEGTMEFSVPFAGTDNVYLSLVPGDPVLFRGQRWIITEAIVSAGYIKLTLQYDRQSAYTSNVQAIPGLEPTAPQSRYSGPTTLIPMNLPALRVQDTYGIYLAAASSDGRPSWRGCNVQISYDGQVSWQNATTITQESTLGTVTTNEPSGGEPLTVDVDGTGDLASVTADQLAANANAFALVSGNTAEIGQFQTATLQSAGIYNLTDVSRGLHGTTEVVATAGEQFTLLDSVYFLPINPSFIGRTLYLRAVGFGEDADSADIVSIVYGALAPPDWSNTQAATMTTTPTASVSDTSARVSVRASEASTVAIKYSINADMSDAVISSGVTVNSATDFTSAIDIPGLTADTTYYYTPRVNGVDQYTSSFPSFKTFAAADQPASFSFAFGSCTKHSGVSADSIFSAVPSGARFLMHLGDTIYADSDTPAAVTLADYRSKQQFALIGTDTTDAGWKTLRADKPVFTMWDDHDITNDFSGGTSDPLYAPAKEAFQEYQGRANPDGLTAGELYYTFQYGDVGFFVADLRSFRSANTATDDASKTILGATQKTALKNWLLTNKDTLKLKFICASVPAHGYAANTAGDSWGGVDDGTQAPNGANGFRTERNEIWDYIDANQIPGVVILSGDQHWAGSFKTTYASRPRYEFMATPFNSPVLTEDSRAADAVNGPIFWKYDAGMNFGVVTVDTTVSPATVSFQLYGPSGSLGSSYLTSIDSDDIDASLVPAPAIEITTDLPAADTGSAYTGSITATNVNAATGAITLTYDSLPDGLSLGTRTGTGDGPFTWPITGTPTTPGTPTTDFSATNGNQTTPLAYTWNIINTSLWTPTSLTIAPSSWVNDESALTSIGTGVQRWEDLSATNIDWAPLSDHPENMPTVVSSGLNGRRTLSFDGTSDFLYSNTAGRSLTQNINKLCIFAVADPVPSPSSSAFVRIVNFSIGISPSTSVRAGLWLLNGNASAYQRRDDNDAAVAANAAYATQAWTIFESEHDWTAQTVGIRLNGGTLVSAATAQGSANTSDTISTEATIGGTGVSQLMSGGCAEVIVLSYVPSTTDRQKIEGYLAWRWGLEANLPAGHPYKSAPP